MPANPMPASRRAAQVLRQHQCDDPVTGAWFDAAYTFVDRTMVRFFDDCQPMLDLAVQPVLCMEEMPRDKRASYQASDGYRLGHSITLNPAVLRTGADAAPLLAHELVHMWEHLTGNETTNGYHGAAFHARMARMGIETVGRHGTHGAYITVDGEPVWENWMVMNEDLRLERFTFGGTNEPGRKMLKWQCPNCGLSLRTRRTNINVLCMDCDDPFVRIDT